MNNFLEVLRIQGARIGLKISVRKIKSLWLGINEGEEVMLCNYKIDQVDSSTYLGSIISKKGCSKDIEYKVAKAPGFFFSQLKKVWMYWKRGLWKP